MNQALHVCLYMLRWSSCVLAKPAPPSCSTNASKNSTPSPQVQVLTAQVESARKNRPMWDSNPQPQPCPRTTVGGLRATIAPTGQLLLDDEFLF
jgi:hypothetical protein